MKNIRTATVTWIKHANFGTYLQAYALQQTIFKLGYQNFIIDDSTIIEEKRPSVSFFTRLKTYLITIVHNGNFKIYQYKSNKRYAEFRQKYLQIDTCTQPLAQLSDRYDLFICGSDQIWYPSDAIFSPYYYLAFTNKKKIAYAPSLGTSNYPQNFIPKVTPLLQRIDALSVREYQGANLLQDILGRKVEVVLDPTLLLTSYDWEQLLSTCSDAGNDDTPYILCYFLGNNVRYMNFVSDFARQKGLLVKIFATHPSYLSFGDKAMACGPLEFLQAIKQSTYFFTDSFHGTIFSIHFEKRFYTFKRFDDSSKLNQNSRIENLFSLIGLSSFFLGPDDLEKIPQLPDIDYSKVKGNIQSERNKSLNFLINALKDGFV